MDEVRRAAKNSGWVFFGRAFERLVRLGVIIALARLLEVRGFGVYAFAFAYAEMFAVFTDFGLHSVLVREMAKDAARAPAIWGQGIVLKLVLSLASWLAACLIALYAAPAGEVRWAALAACFFIFGSFRIVSLRSALDLPFEARLKMATPMLASIAAETFSALCLLWAAWSRWPLPAIIAIQFLALVPGALVLGRLSFREMRPEFGRDFALWRRLLAAALPVGAANFFLVAYVRNDILMLEWMSGPVSTGMYSAAQRLAGSLGVIPLALTTSLLPLVSEAGASEDAERVAKLYRGALSLVLVTALPLVLGGFAFADEIISVVYGAKYLAASAALRVLCWMVAINFALYVMTTIAVALGRERAFMGFALSLALLNIALNALLIPRFDFVGASWASLITEGVMLCACAAILGRWVASPPFGSMLRASLAALAAGAALLWLPAPAFVRLACGGGVYLAGIFLGGGISAEGRSALYFLLPKKIAFAPGTRDG